MTEVNMDARRKKTKTKNRDARSEDLLKMSEYPHLVTASPLRDGFA